ncbi:unnamed protein product, partial [Rotaria sp. Silwood2]
TTCIEKYATYGGTYLNVDYIPSKALFHNFYLYHTARDSELKKRSIEYNKLDQHRRIEVDKKFQKTCKVIYAIGERIQGPVLMHQAEDQRIICVE